MNHTAKNNFSNRLANAVMTHHSYFYWLYNKPKYRNGFILAHGLFVWLFLSLFLPFGTSENNAPNYLFILLWFAQYGIIWILLLAFFDKWLLPKWFIPNYLARFYNEKVDLFIWTVKFLIICNVFYLFWAYECGSECYSFKNYLEIHYGNFLIFLFPYIAFGLLGRIKFYQSNLGLSQEAETIQIQAEGEKALIQLPLARFLYCKADDNYVDLFYVKEDQIIKKSIRSSLKSIEKQLGNVKQIIRVHRSFLINIQFLESYQISESILFLRCAHQLIEIPISRSYKNQLKAIISADNRLANKKVL